MDEQPCPDGSTIHQLRLCVLMKLSALVITDSLPLRVSRFLWLLLLMAAQINRAGPQAQNPAPNQLFQELSPGAFLPDQPDSTTGPDGEISNPPLSCWGTSFQVFDRFNSSPWLPHPDHFQVSTVKLFRFHQGFTLKTSS